MAAGKKAEEAPNIAKYIVVIILAILLFITFLYLLQKKFSVLKP